MEMIIFVIKHICMLGKDLLNFCKFYKGEKECPKEYEGKMEGELWFSESIVCGLSKDGGNLETDINTETEFVSFIAAHVGTWDPYGYRDTIKFYLERFDNQALKEHIIRAYEM